MRASGSSLASFSRMFSIVSTSLCRKYTCPPRLNSRNSASRMMPSEKRETKVLIASRFCGAVAITEKSRSPSSDRPSVRGIGVAVSVSTSTSARKAFSVSFWRTPKRCSSSMMTRPRRSKRTSFCSSLCVPMTMSTLPSASSLSACVVSLAVLKRDSSAIFTGQSAKRSLKVWKCCSQSRVVGHSTATCLPPATAQKAARSATSVFPKPTSPQTRRSIGLPDFMSSMTAVMAAA